MNRTLKNTIITLSVVLAFLATNNKPAYADCDQLYGGGEVCNKSFEVEKKVRIEGDDDWEDKVTNVQMGEVVEFKIKVKNRGDVEVDNMKYEDFLPDEMYKVGGSGLTEYWDDFEPGESKTFVIEAKIYDNEFDRENFEKCIVNKVEIEYDGDFEGSDTATVCYGNVEIKELPETGSNSAIALVITAVVMVLLGALARKKSFA